MARIRTIKPEFFTSEDIVSLSAMARLLYIAIWCEADKEGRLVWKPKTLKLRYFPADSCDCEALGQELIDRGLIVLYGDGLAYVPSFADHQHINPRETASSLPEPDASPRVVTRRHASPRDSDAQGGREGKGREGNSKDASRTRKHSLPADFVVSDRVKQWASDKGHDRLDEHLDSFRAKATAKGYQYVDWDAAFMEAVRENWAKLPTGSAIPPVAGGRRKLA